MAETMNSFASTNLEGSTAFTAEELRVLEAFSMEAMNVFIPPEKAVDQEKKKAEMTACKCSLKDLELIKENISELIEEYKLHVEIEINSCYEHLENGTVIRFEPPTYTIRSGTFPSESLGESFPDLFVYGGLKSVVTKPPVGHQTSTPEEMRVYLTDRVQRRTNSLSVIEEAYAAYIHKKDNEIRYLKNRLIDMNTEDLSQNMEQCDTGTSRKRDQFLERGEGPVPKKPKNETISETMFTFTTTSKSLSDRFVLQLLKHNGINVGQGDFSIRRDVYHNMANSDNRRITMSFREDVTVQLASLITASGGIDLWKRMCPNPNVKKGYINVNGTPVQIDRCVMRTDMEWEEICEDIYTEAVSILREQFPGYKWTAETSAIVVQSDKGHDTINIHQLIKDHSEVFLNVFERLDAHAQEMVMEYQKTHMTPNAT